LRSVTASKLPVIKNLTDYLPSQQSESHSQERQKTQADY
jgi:hypothetical protein